MVLSSEYSRTSYRDLIFYSLENDFMDTAQFTAERLMASNPNSPDATYLYSLVLYKTKRYKAAFNVSGDYCGSHVGCSYIFAKACIELKQEADGIRALLKTMNEWKGLLKSNETFSPDVNACYMVLAKLYNQVNDVQRSSIHYANVLKLNPFIFEAFEQLCLMGVNVRVDSIYKYNDDVPDQILEEPMLNDDLDMSNVSTRKVSASGAVFGFPSNQHTTPTIIHSNETSDKVGFKPSSSIFKTPKAKSTKNFNFTPKTPAFQTQSSTNNNINPTTNNIPTTTTAAATTYDPSLLLTPNTKPYNMSGSSSTYGSKRSINRNGSSLTSRLIPNGGVTGAGTFANTNTHPSNSSNTNRSNGTGSLRNDSITGKRGISLTFDIGKEIIDRKLLLDSDSEAILTIYAKMAKAFKAMCEYDCFRAIRMFDSLPENERNTPWVLSKLGKLHFEIVNYEEAEKYFIKLRKMDRTRLVDMEHYSTLLWHLHKEVELSFLSHELHEIDPTAPQTWISIGNLFSFKKEADEAIKCFQKATKFDNKCVYAYTLQGHEYLACDAFERALECFRMAIVLDKRHYNAFYGIGMVYLKLGDFSKAEFYFRKAVNINPVNVILICCSGMVLEKLNKRDDALSSYIYASKLQPLSMLALFKKAQLLFLMKRFEEALIDFEKLQDMAPDEASVHFLLGKLYKHFNRKSEAIKQFTIALNLDPKGSHLIKEALENLSNHDQ